MLAISQEYYADFDDKSRIFIEQALDLVDGSWTGTKMFNPNGDSAEGKNQRLFYFE